MNVKAKLRIILKANDIVVAESSDNSLWQKVLSAINASGKKDLSGAEIITGNDNKDTDVLGDTPDAIEALSKKTGIDKKLFVGACRPSKAVPYIHLDKHHWASLAKKVSMRGRRSISAGSIVLTILVLWAEFEKSIVPTVKMASKILGTIDISDKNISRSLNNCEWLQVKNGKVSFHPSHYDKVIDLVKKYCEK